MAPDPNPENIQVPLTDFTRTLAREAAWEVIREHEARCTAPGLACENQEDITDLRESRGKFAGIIIGVSFLTAAAVTVIGLIVRALL